MFKLIAFGVVLTLMCFLVGVAVCCIYSNKHGGVIAKLYYGAIASLACFAIVFNLAAIIGIDLNVMGIIYGIVMLLIVAGIFICYRRTCVCIFYQYIHHKCTVKELIYGITVIVTAGILYLVSVNIWTTESNSTLYNVFQAQQMLKENQICVVGNIYTGTSEGTAFWPSFVAGIIALIAQLLNMDATIVAYRFIPFITIILYLGSAYIILSMFEEFLEYNQRIQYIILVSVVMLFWCVGQNTMETLSTSILVCPWDSTVIACAILPCVYTWWSEKKNILMYITVIALYSLSVEGALVTGLLLAILMCYDIVSLVKEKCISTKHIAYWIGLFLLPILFVIRILCIQTIENFWTEYYNYITLMYVGCIKKPAFVILFLALIVIYILENNKEIRRYLLWTPIILLLGICSPCIYYVWRITTEKSATMIPYVFIWQIPTNIIMAYAGIKIISVLKTGIHKTGSFFLMIVMVVAFGGRYTTGLEWQWGSNGNHVSNDMIEVVNVMNEFNDNTEKTIIAPDELCQELHLYNSDFQLFYYINNQYPVGGNTEVYQALNQEVPYLVPIAKAARAYGYEYVITSAGVVNRYQELVDNKLFYIGSTELYDVFVVGY